MSTASVLDRLKRKEIDVATALSIIVGGDQEINPHVLDRKIADLFHESIRKLPRDKHLPPVVPLLLWSGCYYLGSPVTPSPEEINTLRNLLRIARIEVLPISERSYRNWFRWHNLPHGFQVMDTLEQSLVLGVDSHDEIAEAVENRMLFASTQQERISRLVSEALALRASDIHLEPTRDGLAVRYRIDGILRQVTVLPVEIGRKVVMAIKVMCDMNIAESRKPQDGRVAERYLTFDKELAAIRVSTMPTMVVGSAEFSEKVVMRLLPLNNSFQKLEDLGLSTTLSKVFKRWIRQPQGLIIITGPTGSGKTSTLYTCLLTLAKGDKNIATIEDPVECYIPNVVQSQVNKAAGLTFAEGLRSLLRQDPDVVMVGEIRDSETAETALRAALTGHLVLTTLHTNDALGALPRLKALGMDTALCSEALVGIACQRLVRKVCPYCAVEYLPSVEEMEILGLDPRERHKHKWRKGQGCAKCFQSGYLGREGVFELVDANDTVKMAVYRSELDRLRVYLNRFNTYSFRESVIGKIINGVTTLEEVMRVLPDDALQLKHDLPQQLPKLYDEVISAEVEGVGAPPPALQSLNIAADFVGMQAKESAENISTAVISEGDIDHEPIELEPSLELASTGEKAIVSDMDNPLPEVNSDLELASYGEETNAPLSEVELAITTVRTASHPAEEEIFLSAEQAADLVHADLGVDLASTEDNTNFDLPDTIATPLREDEDNDPLAGVLLQSADPLELGSTGEKTSLLPEVDYPTEVHSPICKVSWELEPTGGDFAFGDEYTEETNAPLSEVNLGLLSTVQIPSTLGDSQPTVVNHAPPGFNSPAQLPTDVTNLDGADDSEFLTQVNKDLSAICDQEATAPIAVGNVETGVAIPPELDFDLVQGTDSLPATVVPEEVASPLPNQLQEVLMVEPELPKSPPAPTPESATQILSPLPTPQKEFNRDELFNEALFELQAHSAQTVLRIKKLMFAACSGTWPDVQHDLDSLSIAYLLKRTLQKFSTQRHLEVSLDNFVQNLNKAQAYRTIAQIILTAVSPFYQNADKEDGGAPVTSLKLP
ncbi:MAG: GspE/PulE family protein [Pseudanabaenaceae cyanobacterium]